MEQKSSKDFPVILKVLVGSHAHGLAGSDSDYDYRAVFVQPTNELLSLGSKPVSNQWIEGDVDNTAYEIGHFLFLATKSNPTILETLCAPRSDIFVDGTKIVTSAAKPWIGYQLRELFPDIWDSTAAWNAFKGYGYNQRKKFLDDKDNRANKYAVAWLRTLILADELFTYGTMTLDTTGHPEHWRLKQWKAGNWDIGDVMTVTNRWIEKVDVAYAKRGRKETDLPKVNGFLLDVRREFWD